MQIGKPLRKIVVEPLELPVKEPTDEPESEPIQSPEPEPVASASQTVNIPDYISPIVGYRVWQWDAAGLKSLCGEPWHPGQPLAAGCRHAISGRLAGRAEAMDDAHEAPQTGCTCGIYAAKTLHHLRSAGYEGYGICGEVHLWGTVMEHGTRVACPVRLSEEFFPVAGRPAVHARGNSISLENAHHLPH